MSLSFLAFTHVNTVFRDFFLRTPIAQELITEIGKWEHMEFKNLLHCKGNKPQSEQAVRGWERIFAKCMSHRGECLDL